MYILVVGSGKIGYPLIKAMLAMGHEVLAIEKNPLRCESLYEELGSVAFKGDGTEVQVLRAAGAARADVVIAVTTRDEDNLAICQIAKSLFNIAKTIAVVKNPQNEALFRLLSVDVTVNSTHLILSTIEKEVPGHSLVHLMNLKSRGWESGEGVALTPLNTTPHLLVSINIPPDAAIAGTQLEEIELPPNSFISLVVKNEGPVLPSEDVVLDSGDDIVAVTSPEEEQILYETLTGVERWA